MKISVYIPSIPSTNWAKNLSRIVDAYLAGTIKPDEIFINLAMFEKMSPTIINEFKIKYDNKAILMLTRGQVLRGPNRQMAKQMCDGDIIIYQDHDDMPHERRVEIVKRYFENYDILVLNHSYAYINNNVDINDASIKMYDSAFLRKMYFPNDNMCDCKKFNCYGAGFNFAVHAGAVCIRKELLDLMSWRSATDTILNKKHPTDIAEDYEFCMEALFKYNKSTIIDAPVYYYDRH